MSSPVVKADSFLTLHYRVTTDEGTEFLNTFEMSPATLLMGSGQLAAALENCLLGLSEGDHAIFDLPPEKAFGGHNPHLVEWIARSALPAGVELQENTLVEFMTSNGVAFAGFLRELTDTHGLFDFNHPLSGKTIRFEVALISVM